MVGKSLSRKGVSVATLTLSIFMIGMLASLLVIGYSFRPAEYRKTGSSIIGSGNTLTGYVVDQQQEPASTSVQKRLIEGMPIMREPSMKAPARGPEYPEMAHEGEELLNEKIAQQ